MTCIAIVQKEQGCNLPFEEIPVAETIVHEGYDPYSRSQDHDIALLRLQRPATITNFTRVVCLPDQNSKNENYDGVALHVAGFGKTENGMCKTTPNQL